MEIIIVIDIITLKVNLESKLDWCLTQLTWLGTAASQSQFGHGHPPGQPSIHGQSFTAAS